MANSARIHRGGKYLYAFIDPASGTLTQPASLTAAASTVTVTASGGPVTVTRVAFSKKYPFVNLVANEFKVCFRLSRRIKFGETVTVTIPAGLLSDGTRSNAVVTALSVTNTSAYFEDGEINSLLTSTCKIVYVDPTGGNDGLAAAINSSQGYYTLANDSALIGSDAARPVGAVQAYATIGAADNVISTTDHAIMLFKRGETFGGATQFSTTGTMLPNRNGTSATQNIIFAAYGSGTANAILQPISGTADGSRVTNYSASSYNVIMAYGLDCRTGATTTDCIRFVNHTASADRGNFAFIGVKLDRIRTVPANTGDQLNLRTNCTFIKCRIDNANLYSGNEGSDDWNDFTFREWSFEECVFRKCGDSDLEHALYTKAHGDLGVVNCLFDDNSGTGAKIDSSWGVEIIGNIFTRVGSIANLESNGDTAAGLATSRDRDTETNEYPVIANADGAYTKWVTLSDNIISDIRSGAAQASIIGRYGQTYDSLVSNNLLVTTRDTLSQGVVFVNTGGSLDGPYTRDSYSVDFTNNTMAMLATTTTQQYGLRVNSPTTDDFSDNASKGTHEFLMQDNVVYFGAGVTGTDVAAYRTVNGTYATEKGLGRIDGTVTGNVAYRAGGSQTDFWRDHTNNYSTVAAWEAVMDSDASGNLFVDPLFTDAGYEVSDWVTRPGSGYTDLDDFSLKVGEGLVADTFDLPATIETIANAILPKYVASGDAAGKGITNWAEPEPTPIPMGRTRARGSRLR